MEISGAEPSRGLFPPASREVLVTSAPEQDRVAGQAYGLRELAEQATGVVSGAGRRFALDGKVTIRSGPRGRRVLLETLTVPAADLRVAVPREEPGVFLLLSFTNARITPLMPGEASLFNGADYVGTALLPVVSPGGGVTLPFGRDPGVTVERRLTDRTVQADARRSTVDYHWSYVVRSERPHPVQVEVRDLLPVSRDRHVKVSLDAATEPPQMGSKDDPRGLLRWRVDVPARGERAWDVQYSVSTPAGRRVVGVDLPATAMR